MLGLSVAVFRCPHLFPILISHGHNSKSRIYFDALCIHISEKLHQLWVTLISKQSVTDQNENKKYKFAISKFPSPIFSVDPPELCFEFVDVKFFPLLQHEWISAVDFLHNSDPHIALTVARQVEVVACGLGLAFLQQVGMLSYMNVLKLPESAW